MTKTMSAKQKEERSSDIQDLLCNLPFCVLPCRQQDSKPELTKQLPVCQVCRYNVYQISRICVTGAKVRDYGRALVYTV